jgi:hypothetical protein
MYYICALTPALSRLPAPSEARQADPTGEGLPHGGASRKQRRRGAHEP